MMYVLLCHKKVKARAMLFSLALIAHRLIAPPYDLLLEANSSQNYAKGILEIFPLRWCGGVVLDRSLGAAVAQDPVKVEACKLWRRIFWLCPVQRRESRLAS